MGRGGGGDPFAAVVGDRRGLRVEQSQDFRPELLARGALCDLCELHDFGPHALCRLPDGQLACPTCLAADHVVCNDCGALAQHERLVALAHELVSACGFALELAEALCERHLRVAYRDAAAT